MPPRSGRAVGSDARSAAPVPSLSHSIACGVSCLIVVVALGSGFDGGCGGGAREDGAVSLEGRLR